VNLISSFIQQALLPHRGANWLMLSETAVPEVTVPDIDVIAVSTP
jgi:hypothetical protein